MNMNQPLSDSVLIPDVSELVLVGDSRYFGEAYIFEPSKSELQLGSLYAVGEVEDREGVGRELLDLTIQALQREYYRDPTRGVLASFESALHQANLVLYDASEQGVRDWMNYFNIACCVLAGTTLHLSCAGDGVLYLSRRARTTLLSQDLSRSPITNPLKTFSQVASGTVAARDTLYLGTSHFPALFRSQDLSRYALDNTATTVTQQLHALYRDQKTSVPMVALVLALLPQEKASLGSNREVRQVAGLGRKRDLRPELSPRRPLIIHRSWLKTLLAIFGRAFGTMWGWLKTTAGPALWRGSRTGSKALASRSVSYGKNVGRLTATGIDNWRRRRSVSPPAAAGESDSVAVPINQGVKIDRGGRSIFHWPRWRLPAILSLLQLPGAVWQLMRRWFSRLPRTSKLFAGVAVLFGLALIVSLLLLQQKRSTDAEIQQASELLHEAQTKQAAAEAALIYDNRDQARELMAQARESIAKLRATGLYTEESQEVAGELVEVADRLQKVVRASNNETEVLGDFATVLEGATPDLLDLIGDGLYVVHPATNAVYRMGPDGTIAAISDISEGIGFISGSNTHQADKTIVYITTEPGIAILDTKTETLRRQEIQFPAEEAQIRSIASYRGRLYLYDATAQNIFSYSSTLTGYSGGAAWISDEDFPKDSIISLAVDGNIYTLHDDGTVRRLFKGQEEHFGLEPVEPPLTSATKIFTNADLANLYIYDPSQNRVVIFDKEGALIRQVLIDVAQELTDVAVATDESTLYALDGTRVLSIRLVGE